jgi:hypothetical protein
MRLNIYTIFDTASGAYLRPFFMRSDGEALRMFENESINAESPVGQHPEDYSLFRIGTYDDNKGELHPEDRECLATALEVVAASRQVKANNLEKLDTEISNEVSNGAQLQSGPAG